MKNMTIEEKANLKQNAQEVAEKVKTLTADQVALENYEDYKRYRWNHGLSQNALTKHEETKKSVVNNVALFAAGLAGLAISLPIMFVFNAFWLAALAAISLGTAVFAGIKLVDNASELAKLNRTKPNRKQVAAIFKELKKQKLLDKLDTVFEEYENSENFQKDVHARLEETERRQQIAMVEEELFKIERNQLDKYEIITAEQKKRILPKLLKMLKDNNVQKRYQIKMDHENKTVTIKAAETGCAIGEVSDDVRHMMDCRYEVKFED